MRTGSTRDLPTRLEELHRRFERWRRIRKGRSHIPERLWTSAVKVAGRYGLNRTARALRLDYYGLKKRVEAARSRRVRGGKVASHLISDGQVVSTDGQAAATFLELAPPASGSCRECLLELEDPGGAKMRIHLKGVEAPDLTALSRSLWGIWAGHGGSLPRRTSRRRAGRRRT
jgi:hypothetical protein